MAKVVGDIAVAVGADVSGLEKGMKKGAKAVEDFDQRAKKMAINFAKVGAAVAVAAAAAVAGIAKMASEAGHAAREINNLATVAGTGVVEFQRYAVGAKNVGIEQEKLADIFKDVNDKFGDFMATGAGPLADFFENIAPKIGVTAEQFAKLSGPEALQLYVSSLEKAGLSQQQMTFYMEALASDATALVPLLANGGREMQRFGDEAQRAGRILSEEAVAGGVEMDRKLTELAETLRVRATAAIIEYSDEIIAAADFILNDLLPAIDSFISGIAAFAESLNPAIDALSRFISLAGVAANIGNGGLPAAQNPGDAANDMAGANALNDEPASTTGTWDLDADGNVIMDDGAPLVTTPPPIIPLVRPTPGKKPAGRKGGGGSNKGPTREDLESLQERFEEEAEIVQRNYEESMDKLREFREAKLGTEEEFNALEAEIKKTHEDELAKIEQDAQRQRIQAFSGAFGDLATLMQSENKKLFKIGQAAAIADAVVNGYSAAVAAWEKGMKIGGPPVAAAFTAASLAKTAGLISSIASASASGSGTGAGAGGGGGIPSSSEPSEAQRPNVSLTLIGESGFTRAQIIQVAEALNESGDEGQRLVQVRGRQ